MIPRRSPPRFASPGSASNAAEALPVRATKFKKVTGPTCSLRDKRSRSSRSLSVMPSCSEVGAVWFIAEKRCVRETKWSSCLQLLVLFGRTERKDDAADVSVMESRRHPKTVGIAPALLLGAVSSSVAVASELQPIHWFGDTSRLVDFDAIMAEERYAVDIDGVTIKSCAELFALVDEGADLSLTYGTKSFSDYHECFELPVLCLAQSAHESPWAADRLARDIFERFDLGSIGSSFGPRRPADSYRYSDFDLPPPLFLNDGFEIETKDWFYAIHLVAIADFDGDHVADVLAWFIDHAKHASYFDASPVILSHETMGGDIRGLRIIPNVLDGTLSFWPDDPMTCNRAN